MPVFDVYNIDNVKVDRIELSEEVFGAPVNEAAIYQTVRMLMASRRRGTAATKERGEISGGGKKPWRQKGTGRARVGTTRSPLWRGGGTVFGPQPRAYDIKVNKKVKRIALVSALSMKVLNDSVLILREFPQEEIKTKAFKAVMDRFGWGKTLFVMDKEYPVLELSCRNIKEVKMIRQEALNVYDLLDFKQVVFLEPSIKQLERVLVS